MTAATDRDGRVDPVEATAHAPRSASADLPEAPTRSTPTRSTASRSSGRTRLALALILVLAFGLRAWNLDWDRGTHLHPDERFWSDVAAHVENPDEWAWSTVLDPEISPLNPRVHKSNYVYGTLPLWASEAAAGVLMHPNMSWAVELIDSVGIDIVRDEPADEPISKRLRFNTGYDVTIIGRLISALIDTATVGVVYLLGRRLGDRTTGLLAALLQALTVLHIQYSHFLGSEPWVAFFVAVAVWGTVKLARAGPDESRWPTRIISAVALGLAIGSKLSGIAAVAAPVVAVLIALGPELSAWARPQPTQPTRPTQPSRTVMAKLNPWLIMGLIAVVAYRVVQPYDFNAGLSLVFNQRFIADVDYLSDINQGGNWPWVQPLVGATPLWHPLKQVFWWGMGPGLALAALFGTVRAVGRFRSGERFWAIPLAVIAAYFVLVSLQFYAIVRYLQPAYPIMTALAAVGLVAAWRWAAALPADRAVIGKVVRTLVVASVAATAFWALAFVNGVYGQDNARLAAGDWMLAEIPSSAVVSQQSWDDGLPWAQASDFGRVTLEPFSFGGDTPERIELLIAGLDQVDYVIETSNKFYDSLPKTPARFPQMSVYYERLFDGSLGFELVKTFRNEPSLFGLTIDDSGAEEAFTVYDHPTVHFWKKTDAFSVDLAYELLNPDRARVALNATPADAYANAGMLTPDEYRAQQQGASFSDVHAATANSVVAAIAWFAVIQLAALACAPLTFKLAGRSAGAAWGLTKIGGMIVLGLPIWLVVSWGWVTFSTRLVWFAFVALLVFAVAIGGFWADRLQEIWHRHRRTIIAAEAVFIGVFLAVVALRAANPDLWNPWRGGEKPMELAYFTAVTGSTTLPPYDPWFAGGSLNYYYFGWFLLAAPTRLLGIQPGIAFNLGVATFAAIAAVTVFSTVTLLTDLSARRGRRRMSPVWPGLLASLLFVIIGNLDGFRQIFNRWRDGASLTPFDWWDPSRVNKASSGFEVTEFPAFSVLFADLHPHFMAMGVFGLGLAMGAALIERTRQGQIAHSWVLVIGLGIGSAVMRMTHTWDFPTYMLVVAGAVGLGAFAANGPRWWRARTAVAQLVAIGAIHLFITAPYRARNQVADSGFHRAESSTNLDDWIAHWGLFLFIAIAYLAVRLWTKRAQAQASATTAAIASVAVVIVAAMLHVNVGSVAAWAFLGLAAAGFLLLTEFRSDRVETAHVMTAACWMLGFAILVGVEIFTQNADIQRLNTVFKFWLQVWHLFAVAAAFSAAWVLYSLRTALANVEAEPGLGSVGSSLIGPRLVRRAFSAGLVALVAASLLYPILAIQPRSADRIDIARGPSLQGHLWMTRGTTEFFVKDKFDNEYRVDPGLDVAVIDWLRDNVSGRPTIVEGVGGAEYQWWGRISINTGLPTVLGWRWHQDQQRTLFNYEVNERNGEVADFFVATSPDAIERFLRGYDVSYVVIGALEAQIASSETLQLFAEHPALTTVFRRGDQKIYQVDREWLAQANGPLLAGASD